MLRRLVVVAVVALGLGFAHAGIAGAATYTVCGYGVTVPIPGGGGSCMHLGDAIAAAQASSGPDTIRMLPGDYCPIDLEGNFYSPIKFVGVGFAGEDTSGVPVVFDGPEASLTTFVYNESFCGTASSALVEFNGFVNNGSPFVLQNLTVDGSGGGTEGVYSPGAAKLMLRDVIIENVGGYPHVGLDFWPGFIGSGQYSSLEVDNSAILNNYNGVYVAGGNASFYGTTIAGNTGTALSLSNGYDSLGSDTIAHNGVGVDPPTFPFQVVNTIVANNLENCSSFGDWEYPPSNSWNNLLESGNEGCEKFDSTDTVQPTITMPGVLPNGGPTPSIMTPLEADGHGASPCGLNGVDQREAVISGTSCDVGAVQESASVTPVVGANDIDLGTVSVGSSTPGTTSVSNTGGGLVGVSGVSISGAGWGITSDGCTYAVMEKAYGSGCSVGVSVHPTAIGTWNGTLVVHTTDGDLTVHLHAQVIVPPAISSFGPASGGAGTIVTIAGSGFTGATAVAFGGVPAHSFTVNSDSQITAVVATGTRTGAVTVTTTAGTATSANNFVFVVAQPPTVTLFSPGQGGEGASVTIKGTHLTGASSVFFNDTPATSFTVVSDGVITALVPVGATTGAITVVTAGGSASSVGAFTVIPAVAAVPVIAGFSPSAGVRGVRVVISGSGFTGATSVKFNGKSASFSVLNDGTISALVPLGATTGHITVTTGGGTATSAAVFTI